MAEGPRFASYQLRHIGDPVPRREYRPCRPGLSGAKLYQPGLGYT